MSILGTVLAFLAPAFMPAKAYLAPEKVKADPLSIPGLVAWLETQDPDARYQYGDPDNCLWEHYAKAIGYRGGRPYAQEAMFRAWNVKHGTKYSVSNLPGSLRHADFDSSTIPDIANWSAGRQGIGGQTYGMALKRARLHIQ